MVWSVGLFELVRGASPDALMLHIAARLSEVESEIKDLGQRLVGFYTVESECRPGLPGHPPAVALAPTFAEVRVAAADSVDEAAMREVETPRVGTLAGWHDALLAHFDPRGSRRLWLTPLGLSRFARQSHVLDARLLHMSLLHLSPERTGPELSEFDAARVDHYAESMARSGWLPIGTYHVLGLPEHMVLDTLDLVDAKSPDEAMANEATNPAPEEILDYEKAEAAYVDGSRERYELWLTPLVVGNEARAGMRFA